MILSMALLTWAFLALFVVMVNVLAFLPNDGDDEDDDFLLGRE